MEENLSERQQIEQVQGWVRENAPWAVAGILIGVGALVGWQQWQAWQERRSVAAVEKYNATLAALGRSDVAAANALVLELRAGYARTPYADMAALAIARADVESGKLPEAASYLEQVARDSRDPDLQVVARLRLARVQRAQGKTEEALATLTAGPAAESPAYADVRGDLLADKGDAKGAIAAWRVALTATGQQAAGRELIELKIAAAGGDTAQAAPAAAGAAK